MVQITPEPTNPLDGQVGSDDMPLGGQHPEPMQMRPNPPDTARSGDYRTIERVRRGLLLLIVCTAICLTLHDTGYLPPTFALVLGALCSLTAPAFVFNVILHIFRHRQAPRVRDLFSVSVSYLVAGAAFAVIHLMIAAIVPHAYTLPSSGSPALTFGAAEYFSIVTIATTGYGDITPLAPLARLACCAEILIGLVYQLFFFLLAASLLFAGQPSKIRA